MSKRRGSNNTKGCYSSSNDVVSSSDAVLYPSCVLCCVPLTDDNRSEIKNLCRECLHSLEF